MIFSYLWVRTLCIFAFQLLHACRHHGRQPGKHAFCAMVAFLQKKLVPFEFKFLWHGCIVRLSVYAKIELFFLNGASTSHRQCEQVLRSYMIGLIIKPLSYRSKKAAWDDFWHSRSVWNFISRHRPKRVDRVCGKEAICMYNPHTREGVSSPRVASVCAQPKGAARQSASFL